MSLFSFIKWDYSLIWWFVFKQKRRDAGRDRHHLTNMWLIPMENSPLKITQKSNSLTKKIFLTDLKGQTALQLMWWFWFFYLPAQFWRILSRQSTNIYREYFLSIDFVGLWNTVCLGYITYFWLQNPWTSQRQSLFWRRIQWLV